MSPQSRPAEYTALAAAGAFLIARALGVDNDQTITAITIVIGALPAVVTWIVTTARKPKAP
jgi:hypothetical protein